MKSKDFENFDTTLLPEAVELFEEFIENGKYKMESSYVLTAMDEASIPKEHRKVAAYLWYIEYGADEPLQEILRAIFND